MSKRIELTGKRFGRLIVERYDSSNNKGKALWMCKCDCGNTKIVIGENLKNGFTVSCGCYRKEVEVIASVTHGLSRADGRPTRLYSIWSDMKRRCSKETNKEYKNYGGRGITVCGEWKESYESFHKWSMENGYTDELTIDRKDVNGNYEPSNCKWSTWSQQGQNKRVSPLNTSGISGVTFKPSRGTYTARIGVNGKRIYLGEFNTIEEASEVRKQAERKYWG